MIEINKIYIVADEIRNIIRYKKNPPNRRNSLRCFHTFFHLN